MDNVTLGEVYRAVLRIEKQTTITNGRLQTVEQKQAVGFERLDTVDERLDRLEARPPEEPQKPKRTGLTISLSGAGAVGAWELIRKLAGW